jgi:putative ABC transport system permease protein
MTDLQGRRPRRTSAIGRLGMVVEVVRVGLIELWAHKLRSLLTLTLLMLGVFALVVMTSVLDGVVDRISMGFAGMSWDGTLLVAPKAPGTTEEAKRFASSAGLRTEDLDRLTVPHEKIAAFLPRASMRSSVTTPAANEQAFVNGVWPDYGFWMNRPVDLGRGLTEDDRRRRSRIAVVGATLASKLFGGANPVGRDILVNGIPFRVVGVQARGQIFSNENYQDANGVSIPLETYVDRIDPAHKLTHVAVKLKSKMDLPEVSAMMVARVKQAHHGIEDVEIVDLDAEMAKGYQNFLDQLHSWSVVLFSLAGVVLLVGGVGVLSVMLISFSDRRFEIGLRKAIGAGDSEVLVQFLIEAVVLAALGALVGTMAGGAVCRALSPVFPYGLVVNPWGLAVAWIVALALALIFGLYPALRASRLAPIDAMR